MSIQPADHDTGIDQPPRVGLLAGWGRFPVVVAEALKHQGYQVFCLGGRHHADRAALERVCDDFRWIGIARLGAAIRYFRRHHISQATMAGKYHKKLLYQPWVWLRHVPDWTAIRHFYPHFVGTSGDRRDDTLLGVIIDAFAANGITFRPATDYAPELLVKYGLLTKRAPSPAQQKDIQFGWKMAKEMGRLDVGQSIVVKGRAVLAVEAIEGTDLCIQRAGQLCPSGGFTVVKVAKPNQDMRFDVPAIGMVTLENMAAAGGRVLAIEANKTIFVDQQEVVDFANRHNIVITAVDEAAALEQVA